MEHGGSRASTAKRSREDYYIGPTAQADGTSAGMSADAKRRRGDEVCSTDCRADVDPEPETYKKEGPEGGVDGVQG